MKAERKKFKGKIKIQAMYRHRFKAFGIYVYSTLNKSQPDQYKFTLKDYLPQFL